MRQFFLIILALVAIGPSASAFKISLESIDLSLEKVDASRLGIVVWDQRSQVVDGRQSAGLVGYSRTATGIAYPVTTNGKMPISNLLGNKMKEGYEKHNLKAEILRTMPTEKWSQILVRMKKTECSHYLVLKIEKLEFDGLRRYEYKVELDVEVYDSNGGLLHSNHVSEVRTEKKSAWSAKDYKKKMPGLLDAIIEDALNNSEVVNGFSKESGKPSERPETGIDIIVTKKGDEIGATVEELTTETIKYRKASQPDGPLRNIPISEVFMIKYKDGSKEVFE